MIDRRRHPLLSRMIPITTIYIWPLLVLWWGVTLIILPRESAAMFGVDSHLLSDVIGVATALASLVTILRPKNVNVRLAFLCVAGYSFLGRLSTFAVSDTILTTSGWRSRMIGAATYSLVSTGHVIVTSVAVMLLSRERFNVRD